MGYGNVHEPADDTLNDTLNDTLSDTLKQVQSNPGINVTALVEKLSKSRPTVNRAVKALIDKNLIERRGSKKTGGYYVKGTAQKKN